MNIPYKWWAEITGRYGWKIKVTSKNVEREEDFLLVPLPLLYCGQAEGTMMLNCQTQFPSFVFALLSSLKTSWLLRETLLKAVCCFFFLTFLMTLKCCWETPDEIEKIFKSCFKSISSLFSYRTNISLMIQIYTVSSELALFWRKEWISEAYNQHFVKGREHRHIGLSLKLLWSFFLLLHCTVEMFHRYYSKKSWVIWRFILSSLFCFGYWSTCWNQHLQVICNVKMACQCFLIWLPNHANGG